MKSFLTMALICLCTISSLLSCTSEETVALSEESPEAMCYLGYKPKGEVEEVPITNGGKIFLDLADSTYFYGDVLFSKEQVVAMTQPTTRSAAIKSSVNYWPNKEIKYLFNSGFSDIEKQRIRLAMQNIAAQTEISFVETSKTGQYYMKFTKSDSNSSLIGMTNGGNTIYFASNQAVGVYMHEIMHSLGYFHEHTRSDRDNYVTILTSNIQTGKQKQFEKYEKKYDGYDIGDFDYKSIMLYGSDFFAKDGTYSLTTTGGGYISANRQNLSSGDKEGLKFIYGPEKLRLVRTVSEEVSEGDREYALFENTVYFEDGNGNRVTLDHPRLVVVDYTYTSSSDRDPNDYSYSKNTYYHIVPAGSDSLVLGQTSIYHEEEGYGIVRDHSESYYSVHSY